MIIPPDFTEQLQHQPAHQIFKYRCADRPRDIEQKQVFSKALQQEKACKCAKTIDGAERTRHKSSVRQFPVTERHVGGLHTPTNHTVNAESRNQT